MIKQLKDKQGLIFTEEKSFKQKEKEAYEILAKKMDARDKVFEELLKVEKAGHGIPAKFSNDAAIMLNFEAYKLFGPWRDQQSVVIRLREAAHKMAKKH